jgi:hypothetical protein
VIGPILENAADGGWVLVTQRCKHMTKRALCLAGTATAFKIAILQLSGPCSE